MHITADDYAAMAVCVSAIAAIVALITTFRSGKTADRQADATRDAATAIHDAAKAAHDAAAAAKDSASIADTLKRIEIERRHEELGPAPLFTWHPAGEDNGIRLIITPQGPLDYIITGERRWTRSGTPSHNGLPTEIARSHQPCGLRIYDAYEEVKPDELLIRFDLAEGESCPCNRSQTSGSGHWESIIPGPPFSDED